MHQIKPFYAAISIFALLIIAGFYATFDSLELMEFKYDEFQALELTYSNLQKEPIRLGLTSSTGLKNPTGFISLLSIPGRISIEPLFLVKFIGLLNITSSIGLLLYTTRFHGLLAGVISTALYSTSSWHWLYSRKIWAQDSLAPALIAITFLLHIIFQNKTTTTRRFNQNLASSIGIGICLAYASSIHMSAWFFCIGLTSAMYLIGNILRTKTYPLIPGAITAISLIPYAREYGLGIAKESLNASLLGSKASITTAGTADSLKASLSSLMDIFIQSWHTFEISTSSRMIRNLLNAEYHPKLLSNGAAVDLLTRSIFDISIPLVFAVATLAALLISLSSIFKNRAPADPRPANEAVISTYGLAIGTTLLLYWATKTPPRFHYSLIFFPATYICFSYTFNLLINSNKTRFSSKNTEIHYSKILYSAVASLSLICMLQVFYTYNFLSALRSNPSSNLGEYGVPYMHSRQTWIDKTKDRLQDMHIELNK